MANPAEQLIRDREVTTGSLPNSELELNRLYRPLDSDDRVWMEQLGCDWPLEGEAEWLAQLNDLVIVGREKQTSHPDSHSSIVYEARENFLKILPVALATVSTAQSYKGMKMHTPSTPPSDSLISGQRAFYNFGLHVGRQVTLNPLLIFMSGEGIMRRVENFSRHGLDVACLVRGDSQLRAFANSPELINTKLRVMYSIASLWGVKNPVGDINRFVERHPTNISRSLDALFTVGRICTQLFRESELEIFPIDSAHQVLATPLVTLVAAYISRQQVISSPQGLTYQARRLDDLYTRNQLRGYLARHTDDPVVRAYFKGNPLTDEERGNLPEHDHLPKSNRFNDGWDEPLNPADRRSLERAASTRQLARSALRMDREVETAERDELLDRIADGIDIETRSAGRKLNSRQKDIYEQGKAARRQLAAPYIGRVIASRLHNIDQWSDAALDTYADSLQMEFVKLMMAIVELAYRHRDDRPENTWEFLEDQMRRYHRLTVGNLADEYIAEDAPSRLVYSAGDV
jgi:hypothetical protein